jgi:hypothetical protein
MTNRKSHTTKDRQHNGQKKKSYYQEGQTAQWPKEKKSYYQEGQTTQWLFVIVLSVVLGSMSFSVGHCVVCSSW